MGIPATKRNKMNESINLFGLTANQMRILFSLEYYMAKFDSEQDAELLEIVNPFSANHEEKAKWAEQFRIRTSGFMKAQGGDDMFVITNKSALRLAIMEEDEKSETSTWKYLIMLECMVFSPYYPLTEEDVKEKTYKGLYMGDSSRNKALSVIAAWLDIDQSVVTKMMDSYKSSIKKLTGYWNNLFIGIGAGVVVALLLLIPFGGPIAAFFAAPGLYGAAAISSGLAALGGGAIAAGGFGVAGGMAVLIGGGVLLGTGAGASVSMALASASPSSVMNECAKMYVVLKEIVLGMQHDTKRAQDIIAGIMDKVAMLKKEVENLKAQMKEDKEKIKNLEKSIEYLEKFLKIV